MADVDSTDVLVTSQLSLFGRRLVNEFDANGYLQIAVPAGTVYEELDLGTAVV